MLANKLLSAGKSKLARYMGSYQFTGSASVVTATSFDIGSAATDRVLVVSVAGCAATARQVSGVTIAGSAATLAIRSASINRCTGIYYLAVPSGSTANIAATFSSAVVMAHIVVHSLTGWPSVTLYDSSTAIDSSVTTVTATGIDTANDGLALQIVACNGANSVSPFVQDDSYTAGTNSSIAGRRFPTSSATGTSITHTASGTTAKSICVATFS